jgi:two-component SAPR family response regulator
MSLYPAKGIGYIIRIKNEDNSRIYNLLYDGQGSNLSFTFNEEGKNSLAVARIDRDLLNTQWFKMKIMFDLKNDSIKLKIHNQTFGAGNAGLSSKYRPIIVFGKSEHIIDVPSFAIRNLSVGNNTKYYFALRENKGQAVHDAKGKAVGYVSNPEWLINDSYHWRFMDSLNSKTVAGTNYNPERMEIYYFNRDSLLIYNIVSGQREVKVFEEKCPVNLKLGTNFIDTKDNKLYVYEVYHNNTLNEITAASLNLNTYRWTAESSDKLPTQLHHHVSRFDSAARRYTIFGGFGNMRYSNRFHSYDLNSKSWQSDLTFDGDSIYPRYFSSLGYLEKTNSMYIFGGMGNESGEQVVGRKYFYDLYRIDLNTNRIKKLWEITWDKDNAVPVRGMTILNDSCFYTLCYPEHFSNSFLLLYRFSMKDGSYEILGDSILIYSDKITTNANLYYDRRMNKLISLIQEFDDDDIASCLKIYTLAFPPVTAEELARFPEKRGFGATPLIILAGALTAIIAGILTQRIRRYRRRNDYSGSQKYDDSRGKAERPNAIYLFGEFTVYDKNSRDITYMFSNKLKQVLCLVLQHNTGDGISSQRLGSILWPDKPKDKVKNSRGVAVNHLRKVLSELEGIELVCEKDYFRIMQTAGSYCDYTRCMQIISTRRTEKSRKELAGILMRGKFLKSTDLPSLDTFKETVEQILEPVLAKEMQQSFVAEDYQVAADFAEMTFNIDPLNEDALLIQTKSLKRLKKNEEAMLRYQSFVNEYGKAMGKDYSHAFKEIK